ncbi:hypothetical protein [Ramlibacter sp. AN1133]|uniref:hypothetical protein n=1 Tax=Ramlibacter sp. AN1133 TaxID=3133429 RepID=UPI0030BBBC8C
MSQDERDYWRERAARNPDLDYCYNPKQFRGSRNRSPLASAPRGRVSVARLLGCVLLLLLPWWWLTQPHAQMWLREHLAPHPSSRKAVSASPAVASPRALLVGRAPLWYQEPYGPVAPFEIVAPAGQRSFVVLVSQWASNARVVQVPVAAGSRTLVQLPLGEYRLLIVEAAQPANAAAPVATGTRRSIAPLRFYAMGGQVVGNVLDLGANLDPLFPLVPDIGKSP